MEMLPTEFKQGVSILPEQVEVSVTREEKRLIELFRGLNLLGKAWIFDWFDTIAPLPKYSRKGLNLYK